MNGRTDKNLPTGLKTLAERLRYMRNKMGITQGQLAEKSGVSADAISKVELGDIKRPRQIDRIADVLNVSPSWLQFGIEELDKLDKDGVEIALLVSELSAEQREVIIATIRSLKK